MSALPASPHYTPDEYLALEANAEYKSEYITGQIVAMSGASPSHNRIVFNVIAALGDQLLSGPCEGFPGDQRLKVSATGLYTYPDVMVACGESEFENKRGLETLLNPSVIVEVLSPSTEAYDRGAKFAHYWALSSLQEYILISQDKPQIEIYVRDSDRWEFSYIRGLDAVLQLESINCYLALSRVYHNVRFPSVHVYKEEDTE